MNSFTHLEPIGRRRCNRLFVLALHIALIVILVSAFIASSPLH